MGSRTKTQPMILLILHYRKTWQVLSINIMDNRCACKVSEDIGACTTKGQHRNNEMLSNGPLLTWNEMDKTNGPSNHREHSGCNVSFARHANT